MVDSDQKVVRVGLLDGGSRMHAGAVAQNQFPGNIRKWVRVQVRHNLWRSARPSRCGGSDKRLCLALALSKTLVAEEEERSVFHNRTTQGAAKLVAVERGNRCILSVENIPSIEDIVAAEFKSGALKFIGTGLVHPLHVTT